jgi:hypothetical protein
MPRRRAKGKKETISYRDFEVLEFICRYGVVNREAVRYWAKTGRSVTLDRERRLREAGLIEVHPPIGRSGPVIAATLRGLRDTDRRELGPAAVSVYSATHSIACALLGAELERAGEVIFSERELAHEERWLGERIYSTQPNWPEPGFHRPDLIWQQEAGEIPMEVEISEKSPERLRQILDSWGRRHGFDRWPARVFYVCSEKTMRPVKRAIEKTGTDWLITAEPLGFDTDLLRRPESQPSGGLGDGRQPPEGVGAKPLDGRAAAATVAARSGGG